MKRKNSFDNENEKTTKMTISEVFKIYSPPPIQLSRMRSVSSSSQSNNSSNNNNHNHSSNNKTSFLDHLPPNIPNIDICHEWEHKQQYDSTYSSSIMQYKSTVERKYVYKNITNNSSPLPSIQTEITPEMYAILIDWIVEIGTIDENTLCLAIHILDEYIQTTFIRRSCFQLVGCTCLLIAAKIEQIQAPSIDDFVTIACNCFDTNDMIRAEQKILHDLNYNIPRPTRSYFLDRFLLVSRVDCLDFESRRKIKSTLQLPSPLNLQPHCDCLSPTSSFEEDEISPANQTNFINHQPILLQSSNDSNFSWVSTPTKPKHLQRENSLLSIYEESDLTSNESQSAQSPSSRQTLYSYTPLHGYVPSNERFKREESFAKMLLFITLQDYSFNQYRMSKIAAAIVHLTKQYHRPSSFNSLWSQTMEYYTGYREEDLKTVIEHINQSFQQIVVSKYKNILLKFDTKEYKYCSSTVFAVPNSKLRFDNLRSNETNTNKSKSVDSVNSNESRDERSSSSSSRKDKNERKDIKEKTNNQITPQKLLKSEGNK